MEYDLDDFPTAEMRLSINKEEDIKKLTLEEDLTEIKRAQHILIRGQQKQKLAIYRNLHKLLTLSFESLYQYVQADLMEQNEDYQIEAAKSLSLVTIKSNQLLELSLHFLSLYNQKLATNWLLVFETTVNLVKYKDYADHLEKMILDISDIKQPEVGRWIGAKMITILAKLLKDAIKGPLLDRTRLLCQDTDSEVKELVAGELFTAMLKHLHIDLIESYLIHKVFELIYDANQDVRIQMLKTFLQNTDKLSKSDMKQSVLSVYLDSLQTNHIDSLIIAAQYSGQGLQGIIDICDEPFFLKFANTFSKLGSHTNEEIRKYYLYNLPGVMTLLSGAYPNQVFAPYASIMIKDTKNNIKLGCQIMHELAKCFDYSTVVQKFQQLFECVISNDDLELTLSFRLDEMLKLLINQNQEDNLNKEIIKQLSKQYEKSMQNYKYNEKFLEQIFCFQDYIQNQFFEKYFIPYLYKEQKNVRCDKISMQIIAKYFYLSKDFETQQRIKDTLNKMFYKGNNVKRVRYIFWVGEMPLYVSRKRFIDLNCNQVLNYCSDKVVSVKIQLIKILPKISHYLDPLEYGIVKTMQGATLTDLIKEVFAQISKQQNHYNDDEQERLEQQEECLQNVYSNFQKVQKQQDNNMIVDYVFKYKKRPLPKLVSSQAKKTPSSQSVRYGMLQSRE